MIQILRRTRHDGATSPFSGSPRRSWAKSLVLISMLAALANSAFATNNLLSVGVARLEITPTTPIWLSGYASRSSETSTAAQPLWAKALAFGGNDQSVSILITVDNVGVPASVTEAVFQRLATTGLARENFTVCSTHTHTGPMLNGVLPNLFSRDLTTNEQAHVDLYTASLVEKLEQVAQAALSNRQPAQLFWGQGTATFAKNRRTSGGPVDHRVSLLCVKSPDDNVRAVFANYACHCTTLGPEMNQFHGDWAGEAQRVLEGQYPGAVALISVGCGADSNPDPRTGLNYVQQHGATIANEANRILAEELQPLTTLPVGRLQQIDLPYQTLPTRAEWQSRAAQSGIVGYHAQKNLARLDRGETLPTTLPYYVQTWVFGNDLAMVFLSGEVVVDYSLRLKSELDPARLWLNAYANDVPCYIPSKRILQEGGYETEASLWYYDRPARLSPQIEDLIINSVHTLLPPTFSSNSIPIAAVSAANLNGTIGVRFNQSVEKSSAENKNFYSLNNGTITNATLQSDGKTVALNTSGFSETNFMLLINGVTSSAGMLATNSIFGTTLGLTSQDIGQPTQASSALAFGFGDATVRAGGKDIWNNADSYHFLYQQRTGDFDVRVQVASFQGGASSAKAALMVRENLLPGSRHFTITVYPSQGNWTAFWRLTANGVSAVASGSWRVNWPGIAYPNIWMRLKRVGNTFTVFGGSNGTDWTQISDSFTPSAAYPANVFVGLGTTSLGDQTPGTPMATVEYRNFGEIGLGRAPILNGTISGKKLTLSWPAPASDYTLQMSSNLVNPSGWENIPERPSIFNGENGVTLPIAPVSRFYRLKK